VFDPHFGSISQSLLSKVSNKMRSRFAFSSLPLALELINVLARLISAVSGETLDRPLPEYAHGLPLSVSRHRPDSLTLLRSE
jgi:hypothetical protein